MYTISKEFAFSASHQLRGLHDAHPCSRLHGHNYVVKIVLKGEKLDEVGFIKDYRNLDFFKAWLDGNFDHKHLNDELSFNPTAENMAKYMYDTWKRDIPEIHAVEVSETPKTNARYEKSRPLYEKESK